MNAYVSVCDGTPGQWCGSAGVGAYALHWAGGACRTSIRCRRLSPAGTLREAAVLAGQYLAVHAGSWLQVAAAALNALVQTLLAQPFPWVLLIIQFSIRLHN